MRWREGDSQETGSQKRCDPLLGEEGRSLKCVWVSSSENGLADGAPRRALDRKWLEGKWTRAPPTPVSVLPAGVLRDQEDVLVSSATEACF